MGKVISAIEKVAFFNPANGVTVQLNIISPDETEITKPPISNNTSTGVTHGGDDFNASVGFFETDGFSQLKSWEDDGNAVATPVNMVVAGEAEFLLMQVPENLTVERGVGVDARNGASVHVARIAHVGYSADIHQAVNLITAGADAFTAFDETSTINYDFEFPIEGVTLTAAADYQNFVSNGILTIIAFDYAAQNLGQSTTIVTGNDRESVSLELPANTFRVSIRFDTNANFGTADVLNKTIRLGSNSSYVNY